MEDHINKAVIKEYSSTGYETGELPYWHSNYQPPFDPEYVSLSFSGFLWGTKLIIDEYGNVYASGGVASTPGVSLMLGDISLGDGPWSPGGERTDFNDLTVDQRPQAARDAISGWSGGANAGYWLGGSIGVTAGEDEHIFREVGFYRPGFGAEINYTFKIWPINW